MCADMRRASASAARRALIPRATYRLQLNAGFTFKRRHRASFRTWRALGISHVYCSPYFRARPGSMHGYDVVDHNSLNPEIGDRADFERFVAALRAHGMGHILDIVPNHVGIMGADNAWWMDVLENGQASLYARFLRHRLAAAEPRARRQGSGAGAGRILRRVLERGELELRFEPRAGAFAMFYHEHRFPLDPRTYPRILEPALALGRRTADRCARRVRSLRRGFGQLPDRHDARANADRGAQPRQGSAQARAGGALAANRAVAEAIDAAVDELRAATPGEPASFDALHELLEAQAYRLAYWRVASDEINYRRFFDVNDLAALRMENEAVFEATHRLCSSSCATGKLDGLRIDHPDGLYDPAEYFERLQSDAAGCDRGAGDALPLYLVVEKITASLRAPAGDLAGARHAPATTSRTS